MDDAEVKNIVDGDVLHNSWGYDQTNNDYCMVSKNNGKTIKCQMIGAHTINEGKWGTEIVPDKDELQCNPFNIRISRYNSKYDDPGTPPHISLVGSYPYAAPNDCKAKHKGYWRRWDGKPDVNTER